MSLILSDLSTEYLRVPVSAEDSTGELDPTAFPVAFAFTDIGDTPLVGDWGAGSWETGGPPYFARVLVGASPFNLAPGKYQGWIRITASAETPVRKVCIVEVC